MILYRTASRPWGWLALALVLGLMPSAASADTFTPAPGTADGAPGSLRDAISQANSNGEDDTITLSAGTYALTLVGSGEDANASGDLDITEAGFSVVIQGAGRTQTFIDQDTADRVLQVFAGATVAFRDLTIMGGRVSTSGGGIMNSGGDVTLNSAELTDNEAAGPAATDGGGGLYNNGGSVSIVNRSTVRVNAATGASGSGGGIFNAAGGTLFIEQSRIARNRANRAGGGIEDASQTGMMRASGARGGLVFAVELRNVDLNANVAGPAGSASPGNGGGLHVTGAANVSITVGTVRNNRAAREGGGLWNGTGTMVVDDVSITANTASGPAADDGGGGIFNAGGLVQVDGGTISENKATGASGSGGGIHNRGFLEVTGTTLSGNTSNRAGGGIEDVGDALVEKAAGLPDYTTLLDNVTLANNNAGTAPGNGGGLHSGGGNVAVGGSAVTGNIAVEGGGLWGSGIMDIEGTTISDNTATGDPANKGGGGIFNQAGEVELTDSVVMNNDATGTSGSGGGAFNNGGFFRIDNTTFSGNTAQRAGGGIEDVGGPDKTFARGGAGVYLTSTTLDGNDAGANPGNGGGLHSGGGFVDFKSGTVINNTAVEGGGLWTSGEMTLGDSFVPCDAAKNGGPCVRPTKSGVFSLTITDNVASGDAADNGGGGVFNQGGFVTASDILVADNQATGTSGSGGGLFNNGGYLQVDFSVIDGNSANRAGGGIEDTAAAPAKTFAKGAAGTYLSNVLISGNDAGTNPGNGGGVHSGGGFVDIGSGDVQNNTAVEGGGLWTSGTMEVGDGFITWIDAKSGLPSGNVNVTQNTASGDDADQGGGGIYSAGGDITVRASMIGMNQATGASGSGGGILNNDGTLTVNNSMIMGNSANRAGGGIEDASTAVTKSGGPDVTIDESIIVDNDAGTAPGNGGGIHIGGPGNMAITLTQINDNSAVEGGGVWNSGAGTVTITTSNIDSNTATLGGGLYQSGTGGTMFVDQSLIQFNEAASGGGGGQTEGGDVTFTNSTLSNNSAIRGGGFRSIGGTTTFGSATIAQNSASNRGGGIRIALGTVNLQNTIIGENTAPRGRSCSGTVVSLDYNLIEDRAGCDITGDVANTQSNTAAMLGPLADNGGPTLTHALEAGSPAIDAGQTVETVDQRGYDRDAGDADMGAFELGGSPPMMVTEASGEAEVADTADAEASLKTMDEAVRLAPVAPNPLATGRTGTVTFAVREAEAIEVSLYDATGRRVATLYSGTPLAGQEQSVSLDAGSLAAGVYVVRLLGETVQATQRVTLVR